MIIDRILVLRPLLKFLSEYVLEFSVEANLRYVNVLPEPDAIDLIQGQLEDMFMSPWDYDLNAREIMWCYGLYKRLSEMRMGE